jgi:hypothetical protein
LTEPKKAAKFRGCLRLRFLSIDAQTASSGVDLQFKTSVPEYRYGNARDPDPAWNGPRNVW